ncbi:MAG: hypothetical protein R3F19_29685 [Verrucomicrobiales bacterium]
MTELRNNIYAMMVIVCAFGLGCPSCEKAVHTATTGKNQTAHDQQIGDDIEMAISNHLSQLKQGDPIYDRYGPFEKLTKVTVRRPAPFSLVERLDFESVAQFERADALVEVTIGRGPSVGVTLDETPSEEWRRNNPSQTGTIQKRGNELWHIMKNGNSSLCSIRGGASHPDFVARN